MKRHTRTIACGALLALALLVIACGGKQSMASKSAAAYREAQAKGTRVGGGHEDGGHAPTQTAAEMDHAAHAETPAADHAAMGHGAAPDAHAEHGAMPRGGALDHAAMGHEKAEHAGHGRTRAGDAHAQHGAMTRDEHAGMQHGTPSAGADPHAQHRQQPAMPQMDHAQHGAMQTPARGTDPHAAHRMTGAMAPTMAMGAPRSNTEMQRVQPASTLRGDAFDAPAPAAVSEAAKATQGGGHEGHDMRGVTPGEDRENPPTPMPATRDGGTSTSAPATDHGQHGSATQSRQQAQPVAAVYTCPMHPEVTSDKPGTCPKCGMALVKKN